MANQNDPQVQLVQQALEKRGHELLFLDTANYPDDIGLHIEYTKENSPEVWLKTQVGLISAKSIEAVWVRRFNSPLSKAPMYDETAKRFTSGESQMMINALPHIWPESSPWISKPSLINRACNKPYNLMVAKKLGFLIPETAFTNEIEKATAFLRTHNPAAMKTLSTLWIKPYKQENPSSETEKEATPEQTSVTAFFVKKYDSEQLIEGINGLSYCPVIFQQYIEKQLELRINVVGQQVLTCAIYSQEAEDNRDDYRVHWTDNLRLEPYNLPREIEQKCIQLVQALGLDMGCIDMILTPDGQYVYLEINPVGQWIWVEQRTGLPIAASIADMLIKKSRQ